MLTGHGGNIYELAEKLHCRPFDIIDMSSNVNPLGPMPELIAHLKDNMHVIAALPRVDGSDMINAFSKRYNLDPSLVLAANGTTQFIFTLPLALNIKKALVVGPTYSDYGDALSMHGADYELLVSREEDGFQPDLDLIREKAVDKEMVFICNPNNPTGRLINPDDLKALIVSLPKSLFVVDESYLPFAGEEEKVSLLSADMTNAVILNSMSKIFRIPGLRIGFLKASSDVITRMKRFMLPWNVNSLAHEAVGFLMEEKALVDRFVQETRTIIQKEKQTFYRRFEKGGLLKCYPSSASFILTQLPESIDAERVCGQLANTGILIRNCGNFKGLSNRFIRISLKTEKSNRLVAESLAGICGASIKDGSVKKRETVPHVCKGEGNGR